MVAMANFFCREIGQEVLFGFKLREEIAYFVPLEK
jgi:hypothetical protein